MTFAFGSRLMSTRYAGGYKEVGDGRGGQISWLIKHSRGVGEVDQTQPQAIAATISACATREFPPSQIKQSIRMRGGNKELFSMVV